MQEKQTIPTTTVRAASTGVLCRFLRPCRECSCGCLPQPLAASWKLMVSGMSRWDLAVVATCYCAALRIPNAVGTKGGNPFFTRSASISALCFFSLSHSDRQWSGSPHHEHPDSTAPFLFFPLTFILLPLLLPWPFFPPFPSLPLRHPNHLSSSCN